MGESTDDRPAVWTGHVELHTDDTARSSQFYEQIGMRVIACLEPFAVLELRGGTHLVLTTDPNRGQGAPSWDLMVEDLDATHARWSEAGVPVGEIEKGPIHRTFEVTDPDGNVLAVHDTHVVGPV